MTISGECTITMADGAPTEVITGTGVGASTEDRVPILLMPRRAKETAFVWALSLDDQPVTLQTQPVRDAGGKTLSPADSAGIQVRSGAQTWLLQVDPDQRSGSALFEARPEP